MEKAENKCCTRILGYLEKKGKKKMLSSYKKYWFVLEGGLLLYYRSKDDYETISPCKGSINLGPPCVVKPCPSLSGVFQIQTRITTVTLRAETREEQNKWMQAIISEINPQKNIQRMSHFRYSLENIHQTKEVERNCTPESESSQNSNEDIIQRLQKMGAQTYNPMGSVNKLATIIQKDRAPLSNMNKLSSRDSKSSEHIYERISSEFQETLLAERRECDETEKRSFTLPAQGFNTLRIKNEENRPKTFIIENDTYAISIQQKQKLEETKIKPKNTKSNTKEEKSKEKKKLKHTKSFFSKRGSKEEYIIVQNDAYASVQRNKSFSCDLEQFRDHNENNLLKNETRNDEEENAYSIPTFYDEVKRKGPYEDIEKNDFENIEYSAFQVKETDGMKEALEEKDKKKSKLKKNKQEEKSEANKNTKLKKRPSFIRRVWKKKDKSNKDRDEGKETKEDKTEEDELYETIPAAVVEKVCVTDSTAVQMLSELQNILEHKVPILMEKMSNDNMASLSITESPEAVSEETTVKTNNNIVRDIDKIADPPQLPPKSQKLEALSSCNGIHCEKPAIPPSIKNRNLDNIKSLDEILEELDSQTDAQRNKVKKLIKRFSEPEFSEKEVVLRSCRRNENRDEINSDELSRLLEKLAKVTNAPILTPGVTSSLNGSSLADEELTKLLPAKQRRFSEPDYDIPRPHKSLTISQKRDMTSENAIGSTRFFGPILKPSDMIVPVERNLSQPSSQLNSITPDSLEAEVYYPPPIEPLQQIDENPYSHKYFKFVDKRTLYNKNNLIYPVTTSARPILEKKLIIQNKIEDFVVENEIYAEPRSISMNFELSREKIVDYDQDDEVFIDSLEICKNEVSTEF